MSSIGYSKYIVELRNEMLTLKDLNYAYNSVIEEIIIETKRFLTALAKIASVGERNFTFEYNNISFSISHDNRGVYTCSYSFQSDDKDIAQIVKETQCSSDVAVQIYILKNSEEIIKKCIEVVRKICSEIHQQVEVLSKYTN
jgi:hypothetical protein